MRRAAGQRCRRLVRLLLFVKEHDSDGNEAAKTLLANAAGDEEPSPSATVLSKLTTDDSNDVFVEVGVRKLAWCTLIARATLPRARQIVGEADYTWTRKYWYAPIGLEQYLDLVRRAVEVRQKAHGDVSLSQYDDDGAYIHLSFTVQTCEKNLGRAYEAVRKICVELEEASEHAADEIGKQIAAIAHGCLVGVRRPRLTSSRSRKSSDT